MYSFIRTLFSVVPFVNHDNTIVLIYYKIIIYSGTDKILFLTDLCKEV